MTNWALTDIKSFGFKGFIKISDLRKDFSQIPNERGVYLILKPDHQIEFLSVGTGGHFKGKNPNVDISILNSKWIPNTLVVYIGQAGGIRNGKWSNSTLRKRLKDYLDFGIGKPVGHYGGRLLWQIKESEKFLVCWKELPNKIEDPCEVETNLIENFRCKYGGWPFANLKG